jgi:hypothetical protein
VRTTDDPAAAARGSAGDLDRRWEALASETLSPSEVEALRAEAETSEEGRALWELYRPCDAAVKQRLLDGVLMRVRSRDRRSDTRVRRRRRLIVAAVVAAGVVAVLLLAVAAGRGHGRRTPRWMDDARGCS